MTKLLHLKGLTACLGTAKGKVIIVKNVDDLSRVDKDSIIVTDKITTEYTEGFSRCKGVIATKGGVTCHAAIICREMKKPCVVASINALQILTDGDIVELDATAMTIKKVVRILINAK